MDIEILVSLIVGTKLFNINIVYTVRIWIDEIMFNDVFRCMETSLIKLLTLMGELPNNVIEIILGNRFPFALKI